MSTRHGDTLSDRVGHVVKNICPNPRIFDWLDRGSDERQYCSPGVDLPIASLMRTKYGEYDEYHTSFDTLGTVVTPRGLAGGFNLVQKCVEILENNFHQNNGTVRAKHGETRVISNGQSKWSG